MPDDRTKAQRSETMRRVRSRDTSCERALRSAIHARGLRFRLSSDLPGRPDIVFPSARVAVFVDGCFWHGCPRHCRLPATNRAYWEAKIARNSARDARNAADLRQRGWCVVRVWEHEVTRSPATAAKRIAGVVIARRAERLSRGKPVKRL